MPGKVTPPPMTPPGVERRDARVHCVEIPELVTLLINGRVGKIKVRPPPEILETARVHVSLDGWRR